MDGVWIRRCLGLTVWLVLAVPALARARHPVVAPGPEAMSMQIKNDRLTMMLVKFPQVYLAGPLDADAPERFQALMRKGAVPDGSDVYLDSNRGDAEAGMALGRLFRSHRMVTHVGARSRPGSYGRAAAARTASCVDACTYAWLGGLYRWAPSGTDRIGLHQALLPGQRPVFSDYLASMGLSRRQLGAVMQVSTADMVWFDTRLLLTWSVANNGRQPLTASYQLTPDGAQLTYLQTVREGRHRILISCSRSGATLTAINELGARRSLMLWPRVTHTYFEIDHQAMAGPRGPSARRTDEGLQFGRALDLAQLRHILDAESLGAWMQDRNGMVRYGFTIGPVAVRSSTQFFLEACRHMLEPRLTGMVAR